MPEVTQIDPIEIFNENDRIFKTWATAEVRDVQGEIIPIDEFKPIMPIIMKRGGNLMFMHSNKQVGKILNYEFRDKELQDGDSVRALYLTCQVFDDYGLDDLVWAKLQSGEFRGVSFGGVNAKSSFKFEKGGLATKVLKELEGFEFSVVDGMGNQEAEIDEINYIAKSDDSKKGEKCEKCGQTVDKTQTPKGLTLPDSDENSEKFIKNNPLQNNMTEKDSKKVEDAPEGESNEENKKPEEDSTEKRLTAIEKSQEAIIKSLSDIQKSVSKTDEEDKEEKETKKDDGGEKVKLEETEGEETSQAVPAAGAEGDDASANFVAKSEVTKMLAEQKDDIMKSIKSNADLKASTPRPAAEKNDVQKSNKSADPKNYAEANRMARELGI